MNWELVAAIVSTAIATVTALYNIKKSRDDKRLQEKADIERNYISPERRDIDAVEGANQAVKTMSAALNVVYADLARAHERIRELEEEARREK